MERKIIMEWYVYRHDWNKKAIVRYNIFQSAGFSAAVEKLLKTSRNKTLFKDSLRRELSYYFRGKYEYEAAVVPLFENDRDIELRIDVYEQAMLNFDVFAEYVWKTGRKELKK